MGQKLPPDDAAEQLIHERALIDHLVATFHSGTHPSEGTREQSIVIYEQIRREWPDDLALGRGVS